MIRIRDAVILARTKLKTRKIRTGITVGMSGILFGLMLVVSMVAAGISTSANTFGERGLGSKFIMAASPFPDSSLDINAITQDPKVQARAEEIQAKLIKDKQAEAKRLGLEYDSRSETKPIEKYDNFSYLRTDHPASGQAIDEYLKVHPYDSSETIVKRNLAPFKPVRYYESRYMESSSDKFAAMKSGKEEFDKSKIKQPSYNDIMGMSDDMPGSGLMLMDDALAKPFLLQDTKWSPENGTIPVILTYDAAEKMLGLKGLKTDASTKDRLARVDEIRVKIAGHQINYCYRNETSRAAIDQTVSQIAEIKKYQGSKDYQMPSRIYGLPDASSCGAALVTKDTRTADERRYEANQQLFDKKFNNYQDPVQQKITFQVVGLSRGYGGMGQRSGLTDMAMMVLGSSLGNEWVVPKGMYDKLPDAQRYESILTPNDEKFSLDSLLTTKQVHYAEFANFTDAKAASKKYSCLAMNCIESKMSLMQFGSSSIAVSELKDFLRQGLLIAGAVIAAIAMIIMWGTIGRTIADSRRETAVFRAIGAKRGDISLIYLAYTILLSLRVVLFAIILGFVVTFCIDYFGSPDVSIDARLMFGVNDSSLRFSFFGIDTLELAAICGLIIVTGLISMVVPLIRNVRRNPIGDMRDE